MAPYTSKLGLIETEVAIKFVKDRFESVLARALDLTRVSAPLFVLRSVGLNDNLNGVERPVSFDILETGEIAEVVQSLAKWKRYALGVYGFEPGKGLYTDMNAIRRDEVCDPLHSLYVDQWDWEKVITAQDRTIDFLKTTVRKIYAALLKTAREVDALYPVLATDLPEDIVFVSSQELEDRYPALTPEQREREAVREYGAVFVTQIGGKLRSGIKHGGRAPDYDDWSLNGDIVVYYPLLDCAFELSSMGIRVDKASLVSQLKEEGLEERLNLPFHSMLMEDKLPLTVGGGIGQSRLCMLLLNKAHIGEVQASVWPETVREACAADNIRLL
ncbi:MAG TPA: aspartate--ammonia ligase [Clostridiales bacterium]|nr:aspartate--ammonia ligase [Clostridiales bacterium]HQH62435.1 aspartate--ammonia ligase [Clostridiales bacterium]HQK73740.1 aspartate--ammonia ligase [Clostridiales bacterium]